MNKSKCIRTIFCFVIAVNAMLLQGCAKYTVTTTQRDPVDVAYKKRIMASYLWGIINNPHRSIDSTCGAAGLDEVRITTNVGYSVIHVVTLGIVNIVKVEWKCH